MSKNIFKFNLLSVSYRHVLTIKNMSINLSVAICLICCSFFFLLPTTSNSQNISNPPPTSFAGKIFEQVKPSLLQIRVKLNSNGSITAYGSGFLVSADGLVVTNYHVVANLVMEPEYYSLEYQKSDDTVGPLRIVAIDVRNDLAVLRLNGENLPFLALQKTPLSKGDRGYSLGNPLDIGMSIVEGTYNGSVSNRYNDLFHFTGAINPGMSGGPTVTDNGIVLGINKAIRLDGQMVGYVIPANFASELLENEECQNPPRAPYELFANVHEQLLSYQDEISKRLLAKPFITIAMGQGYRAPDKLDNFFNCSGYKPDTTGKYYNINSTTCESNSHLSVSEELYSGYITFEHYLVQSDRMRTMNFSSAYSRLFKNLGGNTDSAKSDTKNIGSYACKEDIVTSGNMKMLVVLCERQYNKFDHLYDIQIILATLNQPKAGLLSRAIFQGFSHDNGIRLAKRYLENITWNP